MAADLFGGDAVKPAAVSSSSKAPAAKAPSRRDYDYDDEEEEEEEEEYYDDEEEEDVKPAKAAAKKGTVLEDVQFKSSEDAAKFGEQLAAMMKLKTTRRDAVLVAFLKTFLANVMEPLKIDDYGDLKNHMTALYNKKQTTKQQSKAAAAGPAKGVDCFCSCSCC